MGVDLTLAFNVVPQVAPQIGGMRFLAYSRLRLSRNYDTWDLIKSVPSHPLPEPIDWYDDEGIKSVIVDPYGEPLRYAKAGDLGAIWDELPAGDRWNLAVFLFLAGIPSETWVVLYWH